MKSTSQPVATLKGLGAKSKKWLNEIGIFTRADLEKIGPVQAFIKLQNEATIKPSLNFLYAMIVALADQKWTDVDNKQRYILLKQLDGYKELQAKFDKDKSA